MANEIIFETCDNETKTFEQISEMKIEKDITQRESTFVKELLYDQLLMCSKMIKSKKISKKTQEAIEKLGLTGNIVQDAGENKIGLVYYFGRIICYDGGHRYETIRYTKLNFPIRFPQEGTETTEAEKFMLKLKRRMIELGLIEENSKTFTFSQLPRDIQEAYNNAIYTCKFVIIQNKVTEKELSDFCGLMFLRANAGKAVSTNDKHNATYAGDTFFAIRKELASFCLSSKGDIENYKLLKKAFKTEEEITLLNEFREIAKISGKKKDALIKLLIRCADNGYWESSSNRGLISEICDKHTDDKDEDVFRRLKVFVTDFVKPAKDMGDFIKNLNLWTAIMHVFGSSDNNPVRYIGSAQSDRPMNYKYDPNQKNVNTNFVENFKKLQDKKIRFTPPVGSEKLDSEIIELPFSKWKESSQNRKNTICIAKALLGCYAGNVEVLEYIVK